MEAEEAVRSLLLADAAVNALVGGKVYPQAAPEDADLPLVVYVTSDPDQLQTLSGAFLNAYSAAWRFDCYGGEAGGSYRSAKAVARAVREALFGVALPGDLGGGTITLLGVEHAGGEDGLEAPAHAQERGVDYVGVVARLHWREN